MPTHKSQTIITQQDADTLMGHVVQAAQRTSTWLGEQRTEPMDLFRALKFEMVGFHPLEGRPLNVIEQINQTWTFVTAIAATRLLLEMHPDARGFSLAPGAAASQALDIMSIVPGLVGAETCAVVHPNSNRKLAKDIDKLAVRPERHRYAFMMCPLFPSTARQPQLEREGIQVWSVHV